MSFRMRTESRPLIPSQERPQSGKMRRPSVALPAELLNEPYSYADNGDRPERKIFRSTFIFVAYPCGAASCSIGQDEVDTPSPEYTVGPHPKKDSSCFSVVDVYDTYGLDITLAYLDWLQSDRNKPNTVWLATYLRGSLAVLDLDSLKTEMSTDVAHLSGRMESALVSHDREQPRCLESISNPPELPLEILARIINSTRISKALATAVRSVRGSIPPLLCELESSDCYPATVCEQGAYRCTWMKRDLERDPVDEPEPDVACEWRLKADGDTYTLSYLTGDEVVSVERTTHPIVYSIDLYHGIYNARDCIGPLVVIAILRDMLSEFSVVTDANIARVCAWIVQLSHDSESGQACVMTGRHELGLELCRLIRVCIANLEIAYEEQWACRDKTHD